MLDTTKKALLVYHRFPDAEVIASDSLLRLFPEILQHLGFDGIRGMKFINSGPLRYADWKEFGTVNPDKLAAQGVIFIDCGYSKTPWDQHRQTDCRRRSSIGRIIEDAADAGADVCWLSAFVDVIEDNDLYADEMALLTNGDKQTRWPNVALHFRNLLTGLNLAHPDNPERVLKLGNMCCNATLKVLRQEMTNAEPTIQAIIGEYKGEREPCYLTANQIERWRKKYPSHDALRVELEKNVVKRLFGWSRLEQNVRTLYAEQPKYVEYFERQAQLAFAACQREWNNGHRDAWSEKTDVLKSVLVDPKAFDLQDTARIPGRENLFNVQRAFSESIWCGKALRQGNLPKMKKGKVVGERPYPSLPERHKPDVTLQIFKSGPHGTKFLVSTRGGVTLRPVAFWLRRASLRKLYNLIELQADARKLVLNVGDEQAAITLAGQLHQKNRLSGLNIRAHNRLVRFYYNEGFSDESLMKVAQLVQRHSNDGKTVFILDKQAANKLHEGGENMVMLRDCVGREVLVPILYFADFLKSFGNCHNTNPDAPWCPLTPDEIWYILLHALKQTAQQLEAADEETEQCDDQAATA